MRIYRKKYARKASGRCLTGLVLLWVALGTRQSILPLVLWRPFQVQRKPTILGCRERFDVMNAAFVNGVSSHIFDYDDTHLKTIIHPAGPVVSAILALTEYHPHRRRQRERQENDWKQTFSVHAKISIVPRSTHD
jgi:hypothetical protein